MAGKSVNNKNISFLDFDSNEYNSFPIFMTLTRSAEEVIDFLKLKIRAVKDIATYCLPAFLILNTSVLP